MSVDASDLDGLARDLRRIPADMVPKMRGVVAKSALNTKNIMRSDARSSRHFKQLAPTISYDLKVHAFGGDGVIEAEIGPSGWRVSRISVRRALVVGLCGILWTRCSRRPRTFTSTRSRRRRVCCECCFR